MSHGVGTLVRARGREWVVLPGSTEGLLKLRPLGGAQVEETGILTSLERVEPASFGLPDPAKVGDFRSCRLLRDAVRLANRSGTGPFRSFARIGVEPRPYQLVPLLMALRLDPVRLLIADDVGVGKTIEACLILRELVDRGEVRRAAVLCPPPLAEQWQRELTTKFHIDAELVLPGTASRLERPCPVGQSLFERYPFTVVSLDFIKSERRRAEFLRACPELVIVDEAHTCSTGYEGRGPRHQRHELVRQVAAGDRHLILVTATPHSGNEEAFHSLLGLLDPSFLSLTGDLAEETRQTDRRRLARQFVQRRRADIRQFMETDTPFPEREERERPYRLSPGYRALFDRAFVYAMETVQDVQGGAFARRVRWWSVLALLRSLGSSPAAAAATLRTRAASAATETEDEADEVGIRSVMDLDTVDEAESMDVAPGGDPGDGETERPERRRLLDMAREAERLAGAEDAKLKTAEEEIRALLKEGFSPVVFCRFIPTAHYVAEELRKRLPGDVVVEAVTGELPPEERERRVLALGEAERHVLVATDCLSEGINLQDYFDAVVHYDLSWNPTRHEQREGRVDRYGQPRKTVRALTLFSMDNRIDGLVLDVLLRKHKIIRSGLGISVPVPVRSEEVMEALMQGLILRGVGAHEQQYLFPELEAEKVRLHTQWETVAEREKRSRTIFAQESIRFEDVAPEIQEARSAVGSAADLKGFVRDAVEACGGRVSERDGSLSIDATKAARALRDQLGQDLTITARFELPVERGVTHLVRTHPLVGTLAAHLMDTALDPLADGVARRAGAIRTRAVTGRTTLLLVRYRFDLETTTGTESRTELCEECRLLGFTGAPGQAGWIDAVEAERLLQARPDANIVPEQAESFISMVIQGMAALLPRIEAEGEARAEALSAAHQRVRSASRRKGVRTRVKAHTPADVLGVYVLLPVSGGAA
jgi:superfamily II DNA or RNA helicase